MMLEWALDCIWKELPSKIIVVAHDQQEEVGVVWCGLGWLGLAWLRLVWFVRTWGFLLLCFFTHLSCHTILAMDRARKREICDTGTNTCLSSQCLFCRGVFGVVVVVFGGFFCYVSTTLMDTAVDIYDKFVKSMKTQICSFQFPQCLEMRLAEVEQNWVWQVGAIRSPQVLRCFQLTL